MNRPLDIDHAVSQVFLRGILEELDEIETFCLPIGWRIILADASHPGHISITLQRDIPLPGSPPAAAEQRAEQTIRNHRRKWEPD